MRPAATLVFLITASTAAGCFTAGGFGIGWRTDHVYNTRQVNPQDLSSLPPGAGIRLQYAGGEHRGALLGGDSLAVGFIPHGGTETLVPLVDVQSARHDRRRKRGRVIGALLGLGVDIAVLAIVASDLAFFPE